MRKFGVISLLHFSGAFAINISAVDLQTELRYSDDFFKHYTHVYSKPTRVKCLMKITSILTFRSLYT